MTIKHLQYWPQVIDGLVHSLCFFKGGVLCEGLQAGGAIHQYRGRRPDRDGQARDQVGRRIQLHLEAIRAKVFPPFRRQTGEHHIVTLA